MNESHFQSTSKKNQTMAAEQMMLRAVTCSMKDTQIFAIHKSHLKHF